MVERPGPLDTHAIQVVLHSVPFWSINRLMNKHNRGSPISFTKITDRMSQQQLVARLHRNY